MQHAVFSHMAAVLCRPAVVAPPPQIDRKPTANMALRVANAHIARLKATEKNSKPVKDMETGIEYASVRAAAREIGVSKGTAARWVKIGRLRAVPKKKVDVQ